ncbi:hypothetical protein AVEN_265436-1 [Araneus ventricosus]|uniref:Uncharacterized protein n=1 Tax=Araneus ventricosus TaxID=182803 RepID=A0A4Y2QQW8_ARAVE|nr:hypothetical protein AVEN_265436-1 [Araneus ventricosus]
MSCRTALANKVAVLSETPYRSHSIAKKSPRTHHVEMVAYRVPPAPIPATLPWSPTCIYLSIIPGLYSALDSKAGIIVLSIILALMQPSRAEFPHILLEASSV